MDRAAGMGAAPADLLPSNFSTLKPAKPNPLDHARSAPAAGGRGGEVVPVTVFADEDAGQPLKPPPPPPPLPVGPKPKRPRRPRVDTRALTGVRGLAALHVALGHMLSFSDLRVDLIGGAAMPFFYLLSGFVMTLGYGQTKYARVDCCAPPEARRDGRVMETGRFYRNRFARLAPVYYCTNVFMLPLVIQSPGGVGGTQGVHMGLLGVASSLVGINTWLFPILDVGLPPNSVCWTITTMVCLPGQLYFSAVLCCCLALNSSQRVRLPNRRCDPARCSSTWFSRTSSQSRSA